MCFHKGKHSGPCSSKSIRGPSISEEHQLEEMGRDLLLDKDGEFHPDDVIIFMSDPASDGDSKGRNRLIREQAKIIGAAAIGQSGDSARCVTHVTKNLNNDVRKKKEDSSFSSLGGLENDRMKAMPHDTSAHLKRLKYESWDLGNKPSATQTSSALRNIFNVIPHHCGDHSSCNDPKFCRHLEAKIKCGCEKKNRVNCGSRGKSCECNE